ncbi:hypothetical protein F1C58_08375 [Glaciihabitans sp. INWT7]|uniref:hypothetical protein n=1 Tax=Glaciihabitans sp. INWT7 TaxID=2596912 RepID=UPI001629E9CF|nr:hypothetical protein [Glaciihabitans sp. INWT7]QNE46916.1 hypothetical protein F1C58_08375 [Glaciihabitans sp. INWT7]
MTWTKLSDDFPDDCEVLSDAAFRLHVEGLVWSNRKLLNCRIPMGDMRRFAKHPEAVAELLRVGWWETADGDYVIAHHAVYQRDRDAVVRQQAANAKNGAKGGRTAGPPRELPSRTAAPKPSTESIAGSESLNESLNESTSERDRPGLAGTIRTIGNEESQSFPADSLSSDQTGPESSSPPLAPPDVGSRESVQYDTVREGGLVRRVRRAS